LLPYASGELLRLQRRRNGVSAGWLREGWTSSSLARLEQKLNLVPARLRVGADTFPFPGLRMFLVVAGVNLPVSGSSHCLASVRFRFSCSFADRVTAPIDRTAGKVLEPVHF
jgi:hypothetical protein